MKATLEALTDAMEQNPRIFVMGEGIGKRGGNFAHDHRPVRPLRAGPALRHADLRARIRRPGGGAAMTGTRPLIDFMFADFVLDAVGEILNQIAKMQYMSSGRIEDAHPAARLHRYRPLGGDPPLGKLLSDVRPLPRLARRRPLDAATTPRACSRTP